MTKSRKDLQDDLRDVREKVSDKAGELVEKAEAKGLTREHAAEGARQVAAGARRNKAGVTIITAAATVMAAILAGWRIVSRRRSK